MGIPEAKRGAVLRKREESSGSSAHKEQLAFGRMGITGHLDKRSFGGMVGMEDHLEKLTGRIRGGGMIIVIVDHY